VQRNADSADAKQNQKQIVTKKFFKSKIDFTTQIKNLQHKNQFDYASLSDDSLMIQEQRESVQKVAEL